jgi:hypothetical protein
MVPILDPDKELQDYGFQQLTSWEIRNGKIKPQTLHWDNCSGWIYAFVSGVNVRYIGIASTVLRSRLDGYSYQPNDQVGANIKEVLENGAEIKIFGVKRPERTKSELGEEESMLIKRFGPDWNVRD